MERDPVVRPGCVVVLVHCPSYSLALIMMMTMVMMMMMMRRMRRRKKMSPEINEAQNIDCITIG